MNEAENSEREFKRYDGDYDWNKARRIYYEFKGFLPNSMVKCGNPDCDNKNMFKVYQFEVHHLIPRYVAPSLTYEPTNMILLCKKCHEKIHEGWSAYWNLKKRIRTGKLL